MKKRAENVNLSDGQMKMINNRSERIGNLFQLQEYTTEKRGKRHSIQPTIIKESQSHP